MGSGIVPVAGNFAAQGPLGLVMAAYQRAPSVNVSNGGTYTPDLSKGAIHLITLLGATATVANPIQIPNIAGFSMTFMLVVTNASGGASTLTFGSAYDTSYTAPANGGSSNVTFINLSGTWFQLGGSSGGGGTPTSISNGTPTGTVAVDSTGHITLTPGADADVNHAEAQMVGSGGASVRVTVDAALMVGEGASGALVEVGTHVTGIKFQTIAAGAQSQIALDSFKEVFIGGGGRQQDIDITASGIINIGINSGVGMVVKINRADGALAFFGHAFSGLQTVAGSWGGNAAGAALAAALAAYGLIVDNTTA